MEDLDRVCVDVIDSSIVREGSIRGVVWFGSPFNKLVVCGLKNFTSENKIQIWHCESSCGILTQVGEIVCPNASFFQALKINEDTFLTCRGDGIVVAFNINDYHLVKELDFGKRGDRGLRGVGARYLLNLPGDLYICLSAKSHSGQLHVVNYSKNKVVRTLDPQNYWDSKLHLSKTHPDCFFMALGDDSKNVRMINWQQNRSVADFHHTGKKGLDVNSFIGPLGVEILTVSGYSNMVFLFKVELKEDSNELQRIGIFSTIGPLDSTIYSTLILKNKYLVVGGSKGTLSIFLLHSSSTSRKHSGLFQGKVDVVMKENAVEKRKKMGIKLWEKKKVHTSAIWNLCLCESLCTNDSTMIATGSNDNSVEIVRIRGLDLLADYGEDDLKERISFLKEDHQLFVFEREEILFQIRLRNTEINDVLKSTMVHKK